jgi:hypothetical protein
MSDDLARLTAVPSIYEFLSAHVDEIGRLPEHLTLPDEEPAAAGAIRWAPGAMDGVLGHHAGPGDDDTAPRRLAELVAANSADPNPARLRQLLDESADVALHMLDPTIEQLFPLEPSREGVHRVARWLAATATERGSVKLGIALLGVAGVDDAVGLLRTLGAHDEFTLYAAVAFANGVEDGGESEIWALATVSDGWGRIQCVERLRNTTDPAIRRWILRTGFRNSVMTEYLAYIAVTTGGLLEALRGDAVDRELLDAAAELFEALIVGGPAEDIDDWDDGADAVEAYLSVLAKRAETLRDYRAVASIRDFLAAHGDWEERSARGWTATRRTAFEAACAELLGSPAWRDLAAAAITSTDRMTAWLGDAVLRDLGVDTFEHHLAALRRDPKGTRWYDAWAQADGARAERLAQLIREVLPVDELASGAALELGLGADWADHGALDWALQALRAHPGVGGDLVKVGLQSPVVRNRNMALAALEAWPPEVWADGTRALLAVMAGTDPDDRVRAQAAELNQR